MLCEREDEKNVKEPEGVVGLDDEQRVLVNVVDGEDKGSVRLFGGQSADDNERRACLDGNREKPYVPTLPPRGYQTATDQSVHLLIAAKLCRPCCK